MFFFLFSVLVLNQIKSLSIFVKLAFNDKNELYRILFCFILLNFVLNSRVE